jgi:hypothetical protein
LRGQQLTRLISQLRAELGRSTNVSVGVDDAQILIGSSALGAAMPAA